MADWRDAGTIWDSAGPHVNEWFPVDTTTGQWGTPTTTLASASGAPPSTPLPALPGLRRGQMPPAFSIGQVTGTATPGIGAGAGMTLDQRMASMGGQPAAPSGWAGALQSALRGVGMVTAQGRAILQDQDQQQQQQLQNRLVARRQALQEEQEGRQVRQEGYRTLLGISQLKNKALRNLQFDRFAAQAAEAGEPLPADFIDAYKKSSLAEGEDLAQAYGPLLEQAGFSKEQTTRILASGDQDTIKGLLDAGLRVKKQTFEERQLAAMDKIGAGETLADVSGTTAPAAPAAPPVGPAPAQAPAQAPGTMASAPKEIEDDITEANRLFPQVRKDLIRAVMLQESSFSPEAKGSAGEIGLMQLKPGTAEALGVDPHDRRQNVIGGTKYLAQQLTRYGGNEARALAAYNRGPGAVPTEGPIPEKGQSYAQQVLGHTTRGAQPPDTRMQVAEPGAPAPAQTATGGAPQEQAQLTALNTRIATLDKQIEGYTRIGGEEGRGRATATERQRDNLAQERDRLRNRMLEPTRAAERLEAAKQTGAYAAEKDLDKPISVEEARAYRTGPISKRELLEKFRTGEVQGLGPEASTTERDDWRDAQSVQSSITDLRKAMTNPKVKQIIGSLWSNPEAFLGRLLSGQVPEAATPEQREYLAQLAETAGVLRTSLLGKAQTPSELKNLIPLLPSGDEPSLEAIQAKLNAIDRGAKRRQTTLEKSFQVFRMAPLGTESPQKHGPNVEKMQNLIPPGDYGG